ncbi:hypothetical protein [Tardiphaga sp. 619_E2_N8_5]|uniref:DUF7946 domain-containing protein n=1 Tax=unclassified Tardiphaga TaxID=2631404 RepID=UPI003F284DFA
MEEGTELIRVRFDGGLANTGQLHFYEYSRSQYAMARFIATVEHFRRTNRVVSKITLESNVEAVVRSPQRGSFIEDIIVSGVKQGMAAAISLPLSALISYVWQMLLPRTEKADEIVKELAKIRTAESNQLSLEKERTKQRRIDLDELRLWKEIGDGERANTKDALDLLRWSLQSSNTAVPRIASRKELEQAASEISAEQEREREFEAHDPALQQIDESTMNKLTSRLRPMIQEIGLPLRRSADRMSIGGGSEASVYAELNPQVIAAIQDKKSESEVSLITGRIKSYDRDGGVGKIESVELPRVLNFVVPRRDRDRLRDQILEAMKRDNVSIVCRRIIDKSGLPTSLILVSVLLPDLLAGDDDFEE